MYDIDGSGNISYDEFKQALKASRNLYAEKGRSSREGRRLEEDYEGDETEDLIAKDILLAIQQVDTDGTLGLGCNRRKVHALAT